MPYVGAADPEDHVSSNVRRMVRNALQRTGHEEAVHRLLRLLRLILDELQQIGVSSAIEAVHLGVRLTNRVGKTSITSEQRLNRRPYHVAGALPHGFEVNGKLGSIDLNHL